MEGSRCGEHEVGSGPIGGCAASESWPGRIEESTVGWCRGHTRRGGGGEGELCSSPSQPREWLGEAREVADAGVNGAVDLVLKGARERDSVLKGARERSPVGRGGGGEGELCSSSSQPRE
jgi:hypothetical protein